MSQVNNLQVPVQQPQIIPVDVNQNNQPQANDPNEQALSHLSGSDRAAAEIFLKGISTQEAVKHTKWSLATKIISGIFSFGIAPAIMCHVEAKKEKQLAADAVNLKNAMNVMAQNANLEMTTVLMDGKHMMISREQDGVLKANIDGQTIVSKYTPKAIAEIIEDDIVTHTDLYGTRAALDLFRGTEGLYKRAANEKGHAGQSLNDTYNAALAKNNERMLKAEKAFKDNPEAQSIDEDYNLAKNNFELLQNDHNKVQAEANSTLLKCAQQLDSADKAERILHADLKNGAVDQDGDRQKVINEMRAYALAEKETAQTQLKNLQAEKPLLEKVQKEFKEAKAKLESNPVLKELYAARQEGEDLKTKHANHTKVLQDKLRALEAAPNRNSPVVQAEIQGLKIRLAEAHDPKSGQVDPRELHLNDPSDALDSKHVYDSRHRDLCLKAIKSTLGIDAGELHGCTTRYLDRIAQYALEGYYGTANNLIDHVLKISSTHRIVSEDAMELMQLKQQDQNSGYKVDIKVLKPQVDAFKTATQKEVANFAADIIYSGNIVDEDKLSPEERMRKVLLSNTRIIADVIKVEAGLKAIETEKLASELELEAKSPNASLDKQLEAEIARANANAAQFAAKNLRGNIIGSSFKNLFNFFGPKKLDESKFHGLQSLAYAAQAKMLAARKDLVLKLNLAQAQVDENINDPASLSELVDARRALEDFDNKSPLVKEYNEARLEVRLARAEAQAKLSGSEDDQEKVDLLREAIEKAEPGLPDPELGAEFDVNPNTVLENKLTSLEQLDPSERESLLAGLDPDMAEALKTMTEEVVEKLLKEGATADPLTLTTGINDLSKATLSQRVNQINEKVDQAAQMVQEEMTTAILTMDSTLKQPTQALARELKIALEAQHKDLTAENIEEFLSQKNLPEPVSTALNNLTQAITGVDDPSQRKILAGKIVSNVLVDYAGLALEANQAELRYQEAVESYTQARNYAAQAKAKFNEAKLHLVNANDEVISKRAAAGTPEAQVKLEDANQKVTLADEAEKRASEQENLAKASAQNAATQANLSGELVTQALQDEVLALQAENKAKGLENEAKEANQKATLAEENLKKAEDQLKEAQASGVGVVEAQGNLDSLTLLANEARSEASKLQNEALKAREEVAQAQTKAVNSGQVLATLNSQTLNELRDAFRLASEARSSAGEARKAANEALASTPKAQLEQAQAQYDQTVVSYVAAQQAADESDQVQKKAQALQESSKTFVADSKVLANAALGLDNEGNLLPIEANPIGAAVTHEERLNYLGQANLNTLVNASGTDFNSDGMGKFVKFVIQDYFQSVSLRDKRAMISAGMRYAPANASNMQKLGAMLKGAGPVLQKVFQGLDGPGLPRDLRIACQDMKSNLAPIPSEIVEATLLDMVNSSNGRIQNIEVISSLGAASVGQAFLCKLTDQQGQTRECVVKILRPDAANRVQREKPIFEKAAAKIPGMSGTFKGQLEGIMEELDFGIEVENAKLGQVYNKPFDGNEKNIQSVKIVEDIPPKSTSMAMELAPGTTIDGFFKNTKKEIERIGQNLGREESFNPQGERTKVSYNASDNQLGDLKNAKMELIKLYDQAAARHKQLTALAEIWVTEGIFGDQGFFHGDLHAGNIMSDGNKLTAIDFGNATKLSLEQQSAVMTMIMATTTRQSSKFLEAFRNMLPPEAQSVFDAKKQQILESVRVIMQKGEMGDTGKRIAVIISEIQRNGVEIPHAIFNFTNSQIRLQSSIDEMIAMMSHINEEILAIDLEREVRCDQSLPTGEAIELIYRAMADENQSHDSVLGYIAQAKNDLLDPNSELNENLESSLEQKLKSSFDLEEFVNRVVNKNPKIKEVWQANEAALRNPTDPGRQAAIQALVQVIKDDHLEQLEALEAEENAMHSRKAQPDDFLSVMQDVVDQNKREAVSKLGFAASAKFTITTFIHDHITERVSPKI